MLASYKTNTSHETFQLALNMAKSLIDVHVIALNGALGAGKTLFVQGLGKGIGINTNITSPTFIIINEYHGLIPFFHLDFYRLDKLDELKKIGIEEYLPPKAGLTVVEWANKFPEVLPDDFIEININIINDNERKISFTVKGEKININL
jgi:tRNA threonylcarbamoyladenosine biosynthesis protein TsaE